MQALWTKIAAIKPFLHSISLKTVSHPIQYFYRAKLFEKYKFASKRDILASNVEIGSWKLAVHP